MVRLIDGDKLHEKTKVFRLTSNFPDWYSLTVPEKCKLIKLNKIFTAFLHEQPTVAAVPVSELLALRDNLYETDRITMSGLYDLNMLIAKYANKENEK